jgi:UDP-N-acetylmuramate dehydrogenase
MAQSMMETVMDLERLRAQLGTDAREGEPLSRHTTFQIGGSADLFAVATTLPMLQKIILNAYDCQVPYLILGTGANVLVSDAGVRGLVIQNRCTDFRLVWEDRHAARLEVESGTPLARVSRDAVGAGLAGLEWAVDVPGTVGGAVVGNAGAYGGKISDNLRGVMVIIPPEEAHYLGAQDLGLSYRNSRFKSTVRQPGFAPVILSATFFLQADDVEVLQKRAAGFGLQRAERQPVGASAGSVFKRTSQYPAGFLIETAGLKGLRCGKAVVSPQHANFIINEGGATAADVRTLITIIQETVESKFGESLELEIELVGDA